VLNPSREGYIGTRKGARISKEYGGREIEIICGGEDDIQHCRTCFQENQEL
jgi:hypothetical protein